MAKLDFCAKCGAWIAADTGTMRKSDNGEAVIICDDCKLIEQGQIEFEHDKNNGKIEYG